MRTSHAIALSLVPAALCAGLAHAQQQIYSNVSANPAAPALSTGVVSGSSIGAPPGSTFSELQMDATGANALGGASAHPSGTSGSFRIADDFTVSGTQNWIIDSVALYAYQSGTMTNPFSTVNLRIWSGRPGDVGSVVIFGDTTTNRLTSVTAANIYRVFNSTLAPAPMFPDNSRPIWKLNVAVGHIALTPGTYWLDWQIVPTSAIGEAFCPSVTIPGTRTQAAFNARLLGLAGWVDSMDSGKPASAVDVRLDFPFILSGSIGSPICQADFDGDGDSGTDADIEAFFRCLGGTCCQTCGTADFNGDGDYGTDADIEAFFRVLAGGNC